MDVQNDAVYKPEEIARLLKVTGGTIRNLIKKGSLFAYQVGDQYRIPRYALEQWLSPFRGVDWESIGFGLWKKDRPTKNPVRYVEALRKAKYASVKDYLSDLDATS
ncbi:MAG: helix-turn-helix domain-containing protein [Deltaproteobacteria bacterium]|nr:helix-turn-helix domain-containing protein [Deltaproteobacteria bacterium]